MFSLYQSKMNVNLEYDKIDNNVANVLSTELLGMMEYFQHYLDNDWFIKKRRCCYILVKNKRKIIVPDSNYLTNKTNKNTNIDGNNINNDCDLFENDNKCNGNTYLLYFMYNVLNNGWTIKKSSKINEKYAFIKNHEGKKEYFSDNYIHTFLKENFNFKLIK